MKRIYLIRLSLVSIVLAGTACANKNKNADTETNVEETVITPASVLQNRLEKVVENRQIIFGHSDDTAYGHTWEYEPGRSDVKETAGDYPGLINWDLGMLEMLDTKNLDNVPFDYMKEQIIAQDERGGINSISWHARNPVTGGDAWDFSDNTVVAQITDSTSAYNDTIRAWIGHTADFIASLKDKEGNSIPVLFRPWHEHTGSWFWWGADICSPEDYKALWRLTREVFDEKGVDNVLWVYSPDRVTSFEQYMERYPGDEYVDVMGLDVYAYGNGSNGFESFKTDLNKSLEIATAAAKEHNKITALSETGLESVAYENWFSEILLPEISKYPVAFVCVWRNAHEPDKPNHFYAPYSGHKSEESFKKFYEDPRTVFASEMDSIR